MGSKVPLVLRGKEETAMDSKAPMVARVRTAAAAMEARGKEVVAIADGVKVQITGFKIVIETTLGFCKHRRMWHNCAV